MEYVFIFERYGSPLGFSAALFFVFLSNSFVCISAEYDGWETIQKTRNAIENSDSPKIFLGHCVHTEDQVEEIAKSLYNRRVKMDSGKKKLKEIKLGKSKEVTVWFLKKAFFERGLGPLKYFPIQALNDSPLILHKSLKDEVLSFNGSERTIEQVFAELGHGIDIRFRK